MAVTLTTLICVVVGGCALPKPHVAKSRSYDAFVKIASSPPQFQWAYCGSDRKYHRFAQWRYAAMLGTMGRSSYIKRHKVPRKEWTVRDEFPRTLDMEAWRYYSLLGGDHLGEFARDFLREGDSIRSAYPWAEGMGEGATPQGLEP